MDDDRVLPLVGQSTLGYTPGAILVDGEIAGAWQRQQRRVTVHPWSRLEPHVRDAIEAEALASRSRARRSRRSPGTDLFRARSRPCDTLRPGGRMDERLLAFIGISIVVVVVPGPDMALVARNVLRYGRSAGYATSLGICTGTLGWALAAGLGVASLLATSAAALAAGAATGDALADRHDPGRPGCAGGA